MDEKIKSNLALQVAQYALENATLKAENDALVARLTELEKEKKEAEDGAGNLQ